MITYPPDKTTAFPKPNWTFQKLNINLDDNPNVVFINSMHARYAAVRRGVGISVLPTYLIEGDKDIITLMPKLNIPKVDMYFVYPQSRRNSKKIIALRDFLFDGISN